jgi:outer membrane protein
MGRFLWKLRQLRPANIMKSIVFPAAALCAFIATPAIAAEPQSRKPIQDEGWSLSIGAGALLTPNYLGDDAYSVAVVPYIRIKHGDRFFASVEEGVGYNLINQENFRLGPLSTIEFGREEEEGNPFRVFGERTTDLVGLGDIDTSFSLGGFAEVDLGPLTASAKLGQAISGHDGLTGEIGLRFGGTLTGYGPPVIYSFGPRVNFGDDSYHDAFFSVDATQSAASGLAEFEASSGIVSYGLSGTAIMPLSDEITMTVFGNLSRLSGDAANSSLVTERGSPNQAFLGLATAYTF